MTSVMSGSRNWMLLVSFIERRAEWQVWRGGEEVSTTV